MHGPPPAVLKRGYDILHEDEEQKDTDDGERIDPPTKRKLLETFAKAELEATPDTTIDGVTADTLLTTTEKGRYFPRTASHQAQRSYPHLPSTEGSEH